MTAAVTSLEELGAVQHLAYVLQLTLGSVFLLSAIPKLRNPSQFAHTVADYNIVSPRLARIAAPTVIAVECFLAFSLLTGALIEAGLALAGTTLAAFGVVTAVNLRRERDVPCGCFGDSSERVSAVGLMRVGLLLLALFGLVAALASGEATATTASDLVADGFSALRYLVAIGGTAAALMLTAALALRARELSPVLSYLRRAPRQPTDGPSLERSSA